MKSFGKSFPEYQGFFFKMQNRYVVKQNSSWINPWVWSIWTVSNEMTQPWFYYSHGFSVSFSVKSFSFLSSVASVLVSTFDSFPTIVLTWWLFPLIVYKSLMLNEKSELELSVVKIYDRFCWVIESGSPSPRHTRQCGMMPLGPGDVETIDFRRVLFLLCIYRDRRKEDFFRQKGLSTVNNSSRIDRGLYYTD